MRPVLVSIALVWLTTVQLSHAGERKSNGDALCLENASYRLEFDSEYGRLLRLVDKVGHIDLRCPSQLAANFQLLIPASSQSYIQGREQKLSSVETSAKRLVLCWDGPMRDSQAAEYDVGATMMIELVDRSVVFRFTLENRTKQTVAEVWYPFIGGLLGFGPADTRDTVTLNPPPNNRRKLQSPFGTHVATYPGQNMAFVEVDNPAMNRGLYFGAHDEIARFKSFQFVEHHKGDARDVLANLTHFPFVPAGKTFTGSPVVIQFHDGDWVDGGKNIYRPWFAKTFGLMTPDKDWIRQHGFYQMIMVMLPEGNIDYTLKEIPRIAKDGLKYGITSLQIAGWQRGGHDNGYPYYEPDPRLGTWADMEEAIRKCHEVGVKIYFFVNIHVNNVDTQWYKQELKDYNYESIRGDPYRISGWGMGTLASRMGLTTPMMVFADISFPRLQEKVLAYYKRLAEIGADGIHIDKFFPAPLNFNPRAPLSPDQSPWEGTIRFVDRVDRECRAINPDFRISFESNWDRVLTYGDATWWAGNMSVARRVFPELVETVGVYQPYDYIGINDAVRNGYAVMVAPHHFRRSMDYETWRGLSGYVREVNKIRDGLAGTFFFGERLGSSDAVIRDAKSDSGVDYCFYRNMKNGKRGCIITNRNGQPAVLTLKSLGHDARREAQIHEAFKRPVSVQLPARIVVEPERAVFVLEK